MKANLEIRQAAKQAHVTLWEVANHMGISEPTMTRWLRVELSEDRRQRILAAIEQLGRENNASA